MNMRDELDRAYPETPEVFHRRVQDTLAALRRQEETEEPVMKRKIRWGAVLLAALLLASTVGVAAKLTGVLGFITNTAAKNWVLHDADAMIHENAAQTVLGDCVLSVKEWICDGERLLVTVSIVDPALKTEGHYLPEDEEEEYLGGINHYGLCYGPQDVRLSAGEAGNMSSYFTWGDEAGNEILYTLEAPVAVAGDAFTVTIPVTCSAGMGELQFEVTPADFGCVRDFELPDPLVTPEYTLALTKIRVTALRTYMTAQLTFAPDVPQERREELIYAYLYEGLVVPDGRFDAVAGEGEEIAMGQGGMSSSDDGLVCTMQLVGNPRETFDGRLLYCPRWGMMDDDWESPMPPLSPEDALMFEMREMVR